MHRDMIKIPTLTLSFTRCCFPLSSFPVCIDRALSQISTRLKIHLTELKQRQVRYDALARKLREKKADNARQTQNIQGAIRQALLSKPRENRGRPPRACGRRHYQQTPCL